jgi:hypothetical protein
MTSPFQTPPGQISSRGAPPRDLTVSIARRQPGRGADARTDARTDARLTSQTELLEREIDVAPFLAAQLATIGLLRSIRAGRMH